MDKTYESAVGFFQQYHNEDSCCDCDDYSDSDSDYETVSCFDKVMNDLRTGSKSKFASDNYIYGLSIYRVATPKP